jgi:hypothetical protein
MQLPLLEQASPTCRFGVHTPPAQNWLGAQSVSSVQLPAQAVPAVLHWNGAQSCRTSAGQWPVPVQNASIVALSFVQLACRQTVPGPA